MLNHDLNPKKISRNLNELDDLDDPILFSPSGSSRVTSSSSSSCSTTSLKNASNNNGCHLKLETTSEKTCNSIKNDQDTLKNQSCSCFLLNQVYESYDSVNCDEDHVNDNNNNNYKTVNNTISSNNNEDLVLITDEEKNEYYANKSLYLTERKNRREMLEAQFQSFKLNSSFKIKPRNVS